MLKRWITAALTVAWLALPGAGVNLAHAGAYLTGDFHNHTPGSDGTAGAQVLIDKSMGYNLDWFVQSGHGGAFSRDLRVSDPEYDGNATGEGNFWANTVGAGAFKGDPAPNYLGQPSMWKWQIIQEYLYPITWQNSLDKAKPIWTGFEWQMPGHEHCSTSILTGQFPNGGGLGNANAMAQFEYLFDYKDNDTSEGGGQGWTGKIANPPSSGTGVGIAGHAKSVAAAQWMEQYHPYTAYMVPAHIERMGVWNPDRGGNNTGYNVESFRDLNNAGPHVCFGFEGQPGHQADPERGGFGTGAFGGGTFGGTGYYSATIGYLWDGLLGEGRNWWLFASSDYHNRGVPEYNSAANPGGWQDVTSSAADFWPGEYQKDYIFVNQAPPYTAQGIIDGMRSGNSFIVQGDLITGLNFTAQLGGTGGTPVTMGQVLKAAPNRQVTLKIMVKIPTGTNNCPYTFNNPSLAQVGMNQPLNQPVLHHVDLIGGEVYGKRTPGTTAYNDPTNPTASIKQTVLVSDMTDEGNGWKSFTYTFTSTKSCYFRLRGTNLPPNTPNETDAQGNPLADTLAGNILYTHPTLGANTSLDTDVEAWSDLWFYSNPIFINVPQPLASIDYLLQE